MNIKERDGAVKGVLIELLKYLCGTELVAQTMEPLGYRQTWTVLLA